MALHLLAAVTILRFVFPRVRPQRRRALVGWWSAKLLAIVGIATRVEGEPPGEAEMGAMIAANHVSWLDIFAISSVRPTRFIAKSEIRDWPVAGWVVERAGTIFIRRDRRHDTARINEVVHAALVDGDRVGLFPEGTTTEGDRVLKFHSSLFAPAVANKAHVHPCALRYEHSDGTLCRAAAYFGELSFMQSLGLVIRQRGVVARIAFAPAVETAQITRREAAMAARHAVATLLCLDPEGTPPRTAADPRDAPP